MSPSSGKKTRLVWREKGSRVRGQEVLALADPHHEWGLLSRGHEQVRDDRVDRDKGEMPLHFEERVHDRLGEVALVVAFDQFETVSASVSDQKL